MTETSKLKDSILRLLQSGAAGNASDFLAWVQFTDNITATPEDVTEVLKLLEQESHAKNHAGITGEYCGTDKSECLNHKDYTVAGNLKGSPIQLVRSRLESFLLLNGIPQEIVMDISIATTEAMENAVKYNDKQPIEISYNLNESGFQIQIINGLAEVILEKDIEAGKYDGSLTLMRGMMVMQRLFDEVEIDIVEPDNKAVFRAVKQVS